MTERTRDPLLAFSRFFLIFTMGMSVLAGAAVAIAIPVVIAFQERVLKEIGAAGAPPETIGAILLLLAALLVCIVLAFFFFRHLYRIVGSVGAGDPFAPINADRLSAMGWISVTVQLVGIPIGAMAMWLESVTKDAQGDYDISMGGILLTLTLFILARVFRRGAEMRAELEGTV